MSVVPQEFLLKVLQNPSEAFYIMDESLKIEYANETACRSLGYSLKELSNMKIYDIDTCLPPTSIDNIVAQKREDANNILTFQTRHRTKDGKFISVEVTTTNLQHENKTLSISLVSSLDDVKRAETALDKAKDKKLFLFEFAMNNTDEAIYILDISLKILHVNDAACKMLGYSYEELTSMNVYNIDAQYSQEKLTQVRWESLHHFETLHRTKDGSVIDVEIVVFSYVDDGVQYWFSIVKDIRKQKQIHEQLLKGERELRNLADNIPVLIIRFDTQGRYLYVNNKHKEHLIDVDLEALAGKKISDIFPDGRYALMEEAIHKVVLSGKEERFYKVPSPTIDGRMEIHDISILPEFNEKGNVISVLVVGQNMTDVYHTQDELKVKESELRLLTETSPGMLSSYHLKSDGTVSMSYVSPNIKELFGLRPDEVTNDATPLMKLTHPDDIKMVEESIAKSAQEMSVWHERYRIIHPQKGERWMESHTKPISQPDGSVIWFGSIYDITEQKKVEEQLEYFAYNDLTTALYNRTWFLEQEEKILTHAREESYKVALLFIDLDGFKVINDSFGHIVGDELLHIVGSRFKTVVSDLKLLSRYGGDEFLILIPNFENIEKLTNEIDSILEVFQEPFEVNKEHFSITASIGVSIFPDDGLNYAELLSEADIAMYRAKANGKNSYTFSQKGMSLELRSQYSLQNQILDGIKNREFVLYYQPQIDLHKGGILGVEALIRWQHTELGFLPPSEFISIAESSGYIVELGEWIIQEACNQAALWQKEGRELVVAVNISAVQFKRSNLVETIKKALSVSGANPRLLELEITESLMVDDTQSILSTVSELKELGIQLSIDDFGTGYSSLSYLKRFAADKLKIDRSFVMDVLQDEDDAGIVRAIIQMAKALHLRTIAEGVEDKETFEMLKEYGCDEIQGYYCAKPLDIKSFEAECKNNSLLACRVEK